MRTYRRLITWLYRQLLKRDPYVAGAINREPVQLRVMWNDPVSEEMPPIFVVELRRSSDQVVRMVLSPAQSALFVGYFTGAIDDSRRKFGYDEAPDFDVRGIIID